MIKDLSLEFELAAAFFFPKASATL